MKLFLTSRGVFGDLRDEDRQVFFDLVGKPSSEIRVALIPTAGYPYIKQEYIDAAFEHFGSYGMALEIVDLKEEDEQSIEARLSAVDVIYVNGGSTYWLLHWVRKTGFEAIVRRLLDQGKVYVGVSAGSIIAGPDIRELTRSENDFGIEDTSGMRLVEFGIWPHYSAENPVDFSSAGFPIVCLPDHQAVLVDGGEIRIIGEGPRTTFNGFRETA
jgi:dipeptidase E